MFSHKCYEEPYEIDTEASMLFSRFGFLGLKGGSMLSGA